MKPDTNENLDVADEQQWEAVEEATELLLENRPMEALSLLRDLIKQDPKNAYAYYYTGSALFEIGRFDEATIAFQAALKLAPHYLAAMVGLAHCLRIQGNPHQAIQFARKVLEHRKGDSDALFALGLAQAAAGDRTGAIRSLQAFLRSNPEFEVSMEARAMLSRLGVTDDKEGIVAPKPFDPEDL